MRPFYVCVSLLGVMTACVYNDEVYEMCPNGMADDEDSAIECNLSPVIYSDGVYDDLAIPKGALAHVAISIRNAMPDMRLTVEELKIVNVHLSGAYHWGTDERPAYWTVDTVRAALTIAMGHVEVGYGEGVAFPALGHYLFIPQRQRAWPASGVPQGDTRCYMLLKCCVAQMSSSREGVVEEVLWGDGEGGCAELAIPLNVDFKCGEVALIVLTMAADCSWYDVSGESPQPLFVPITFDADVDGWMEAT